MAKVTHASCLQLSVGGTSKQLHVIFVPVLCLSPPDPEATMKSSVDVNVGARGSAVVLLTIFHALSYVNVGARGSTVVLLTIFHALSYVNVGARGSTVVLLTIFHALSYVNVGARGSTVVLLTIFHALSYVAL